MLKWPTRARAAIRKLFQPLQEIDVYVEDENDEVFYRALLNAVTGGQPRVARVFALGGRTAVIEAARSYADPKRRALFLIDGDLEWVSGAPSDGSLEHLHRHDAYCVENLILCEEGLVLIITQDVVLSEEDARQRLDFDQWLTDFSEPLLELFAAFATVHQFCPELPTVSIGVGSMCSPSSKNKPQRLDREKVAFAKSKALDAAVAAVGEEQASHAYNVTLSRIKRMTHPSDAISGKDFLMPLAHFRLQALGCRLTRRALRMRLAMSCNVQRLTRLRDAVRSASMR